MGHTEITLYLSGSRGIQIALWMTVTTITNNMLLHNTRELPLVVQVIRTKHPSAPWFLEQSLGLLEPM